jgi:hypothetical protein
MGCYCHASCIIAGPCMFMLLSGNV